MSTHQPESEQPDPHVSCSFSIPVSVKEDMDDRAKRLRLSRTDYIKLIILWDLNKGKDAPFDFPLSPGPEPASAAAPGSAEPKKKGKAKA
jgi:hypothetical protein